MKKTATLENIKQFDKSNMLEVLLDFPEQCFAARDIAGKAVISFAKRDFKNIVFAGLGGSAIGGDLIRSFLYAEGAIPIAVVREYGVPAYVDTSSLVIISSYSGNTEETLAAYAAAKAKGATIIVVTSGGKAREYAQKDGLTCILVPPGLQPRCALGYLSIVPLCVLAKLGLIRNMDAEISEMIKTLQELKEKHVHPRVGIKDNVAKLLADKIYDKFPVIYSASLNLDTVVARFRAQLNENSKTLASSHLLPEMNHNEIVGWQNPGKLFKDFLVVVLRDKGIHPSVAKRIEITEEIIRKEGVEVVEVWSRGEGLLSRLYSLIYIGDFISFYLAIMYGIDPTPVERIAYLKSRLAK